ncbi:putative uncharacterized protein [Prevotella sp. CAG:755]|nr:putative uncharacterized protein [Prevotella sp. CAG:755]
MMDDALDDYIRAHTTSERPELYRLWRATNTQLVRGRMASGHVQGQLLRMLVGMVRPRRVLEVGTFSGYSALAMAAALPPGGELYTFEVNDEMEDFARGWFDASPYGSRIRFTVGDALTLVPALGLDFDFVFIDGDKRQYADYYAMAKHHLAPGGYIVADNTLWDGHVVDPAYDRDAQTQGIRRFNDVVVADSEVECVILPLRDGLTLIHHLGAPAPSDS